MKESDSISHPKFAGIETSKVKAANIRLDRQDSLSLKGKGDRITTAATASVDNDFGIDELSMRICAVSICERASPLFIEMRKPGNPPAAEHWLRTQLSGHGGQLLAVGQDWTDRQALTTEHCPIEFTNPGRCFRGGH
jgi:hypothetical protein